MAVQLEKFSNAGTLAAAAAAAFSMKVEKRPERVFAVALPGGRIAAPFFAATAALVRAKPEAWENVHFFWSDERCVPPEDAASNYALAAGHLFSGWQPAASRIHRVRGEFEPSAAASDINRQARQFFGLSEGQIPSFDLIFLGMGEDGHVASLFPGQNTGASRECYIPVRASKPPPDRISMTYEVLRAAEEVWVLVSGEQKEEALKLSLAGSETPLGRVLQLREHTRIFTDLKM